MGEIVNSSQKDHQSRHQALVELMVAELRPVRRLWPVRVRLTIWIAVEAVLLLLVIRNTRRTDLGEQFENLWFLLGIGSFATAGAIGAALALKSAIPGRAPSRMEMGLPLALTVVSALLLLHEPIDLAMPLQTFIHQGVPCIFGIAIFASLPLLGLLWAAKRGAPLAGGTGGALAGAAAFLFSFALMRVDCPIDEGLHLFIWHFLPALIGVTLSAGAGFLLFRKRSRADRPSSR